jgi:hypothetical protein
MRYLARARGRQVPHTWFSVMNELAFRCKAHKIVVSLTKWQLLVAFLLLTAFDTLFSWQQQQKIQIQTRTSFIVTKQSKTSTALCYELGYSFFTSSPNWGGVALQTSLKEPFQYMSMCCSCSQFVRSEMLLAADGFPTHSHFKTSTYEYLKYNEYYFYKTSKCLMEMSFIICFIVGKTCFKSRKHVRNITFWASSPQFWILSRTL